MTDPNQANRPTVTSQRTNSVLDGKKPSKKLLKHVAKTEAAFADIAHDIDEPDFDNQDSEIMYL